VDRHSSVTRGWGPIGCKKYNFKFYAKLKNYGNEEKLSKVSTLDLVPKILAWSNQGHIQGG